MIYFNGAYCKPEDAKISVFDAGYYFGDGIYEMILLYEGKVVDLEPHLDRMEKITKEVRFKNVPSREYITSCIKEVARLNPHIRTGSIYIQLTRGCTPRSHHFIDLDLKPNMMIMIREFSHDIYNVVNSKLNCMLQPDQRRYRRDIKMISLMPMVLSKLEAEENGFDDLIYYDRESKAITESSSSNVFIVRQDGVVVTHPLGVELLHGTARKHAIDFLREEGVTILEEKFYANDLFAAKECFFTGSFKWPSSVVSVNNVKIGDGEIGEITKLVHKKSFEFINSCPTLL